MNIQWSFRAIERERERESATTVAHFQRRTDWNTDKERIYYRFHILESSHYNAYVINVYGRFVLYFYLHYQVIPKIACMFLKSYEVRKQF